MTADQGTRPYVHDAVLPAPELDTLFAPRSSGYLGADAALSIPLPDGRVLWAFGDTLVGCLQNGARSIEGMPRNTVAIQHPGKPDPEQIEWFFTDEEGRPATFFRLPFDEEDRWFWPGTGCCIDGQLFIFGYGVSHAPGECDALSFRVHDGWLMRVRDTSDGPMNWRVEVERMPYPAAGAWFCSACRIEPPWLYLLGLVGNLPGLLRTTSSVLARVRVDHLLSHRAAPPLEFLANPAGTPEWSTDPESMISLYKPGVTECSLLYDAPRRRYIATAYYGKTPEFFLVEAPSLTGPWSEPTLLFLAQDHDPPEKFLSYTLRLHPHLAAGPDEIVATYVVNPRGLPELAHNPGVYYPRFLRIDLTRL